MNSNNDVLSCIKARRSTRKFTPEQITPEQLEAILDAAVWAPSGSNSQTWHFTAIQNKNVLEKLNALVREAFKTWQPNDVYAEKAEAIRAGTQNEEYNFYYNAPTLIIASNRPNYNNALADCAAATQNILLAAHSLSLGSCYINQLHWLQDNQNLRAYLADLGLPNDQVICSSAAIGHTAVASGAPPRKDNVIRIIQ